MLKEAGYRDAPRKGGSGSGAWTISAPAIIKKNNDFSSSTINIFPLFLGKCDALLLLTLLAKEE